MQICFLLNTTLLHLLHPKTHFYQNQQLKLIDILAFLYTFVTSSPYNDVVREIYEPTHRRR